MPICYPLYHYKYIYLSFNRFIRFNRNAYFIAVSQIVAIEFGIGVGLTYLSNAYRDN